MSWINTPTYNIQRPTGRCALTDKPLGPGDRYIAALVEADAAPNGDDRKDANGAADTGQTADAGLRRIDISIEAWERGQRPEGVFSFWQSTVPMPNEKKKQFVDDEVLMNLLIRLEDTDQPQRLAFRFVLALILMRKKLLRYEGTVSRPDKDGQEWEWWRMTPKPSLGMSDQPIDVLNPRMDDQQTQQVTEQLGEILEAEL